MRVIYPTDSGKDGSVTEVWEGRISMLNCVFLREGNRICRAFRVLVFPYCGISSVHQERNGGIFSRICSVSIDMREFAKASLSCLHHRLSVWLFGGGEGETLSIQFFAQASRVPCWVWVKRKLVQGQSHFQKCVTRQAEAKCLVVSRVIFNSCA
jgi:hypothetical protein